MVEKRLKEAKKLGFKTCIVPKANFKEVNGFKDIEIIFVSNINELLNLIIK